MPIQTKSAPLNLADAPDVLTVEEAARVLRLGEHAMYAAVRTGEVPSIKIGMQIRIAKSTLERLLNQE